VEILFSLVNYESITIEYLDLARFDKRGSRAWA
jgi:hypothetical protein